ncbi:MAG: hypothetical protein AB1425_10955 [Actinomycetota bacterium]
MLGGLAWSAKAVLDGMGLSTPGFDPGDALLFAAPPLFFAGLAGLYRRYAAEVAAIGRAGFTQSFIGLAVLALGFPLRFVIDPGQAIRIPAFGLLILAIGLALLGFGTLKTGALPRWNFLPVAMGLLIPFGTLAGGIEPLRAALSALFGAGWAMLGYILWSASGSTEPGPPRAK